jgi:hypothetical protein
MNAMERHIPDAVEGVYMMLHFAASTGVEINRETIDTVAATRQSLGSLTHEQETDFWLAYAEVARRISPVTLDSIRANTETSYGISLLSKTLHLFSSSETKVAVAMYRHLTFFLLAFFLLLQIYNFVGMSALNDIEAIENSSEFAVLWEKKGDKKILTPAEMNLEMKLFALKELATRWSSYALFLVESVVPRSIWAEQKESEAADDSAATFLNKIRSSIKDQTLARYVVKFLNLYILPLICGILGVCSYILRNLAEDLKRKTFCRGTRILMGLRIPLGCLAGVFSGFIFDGAANKGMVPVLPPIGMAFAVGYSMEVFFNTLDEMLGVLLRKARAVQ